VKDPGDLDGDLPVGALVGDAGVTGKVGVLGARVPLGALGAMLGMGAFGVFVGTGALGALVANGVAVVGAAVRGDGIERGPATGNVTGTGAAVGACKGRGEVTGVGTATGIGARAETGTEFMGEVAGVAVTGVEVATLGEVTGEFTWATAGALVGNLGDTATGPVTEEHIRLVHSCSSYEPTAAGITRRTGFLERRAAWSQSRAQVASPEMTLWRAKPRTCEATWVLGFAGFCSGNYGYVPLHCEFSLAGHRVHH
jgi:hypothetical protein